MSIEVRKLNYTYGAGTTFETRALKEIDLTIPDGQFLGIIGRTGSGKSTLIQHLNGLYRADSGEILVNGENIYAKDYSMKKLRQQVGLVFQYPEHQLFEETVLKDVCFGPMNQGLSQKECEQRAREALSLTGVTEDLYEKSPFELSGGQKRRVAIAGVLAMHPQVLILDEPTAGLDPGGRDDLLHQLRSLHKETGLTVILVSHSMDDVAEFVQRLIVVCDGEIRFDGTPEEVFRNYRELEQIGLAAPQVTYIMHSLRENGLDVDPDITRIQDAAEAICRALGKE